MKKIESVYLAGKMREADWRLGLFDKRVKYDSQLNLDPAMGSTCPWPEYSDETVSGLRYTGPFFVDLCSGHVYAHFEGDEHGSNIRRLHDGGFDDGKRYYVQQWCLDAIYRANLVFAWIDSTDCYGTIAEIGYARALGKTIWIAGPTQYDDLWFVYGMAKKVVFTDSSYYDSPHEILHYLLHEHKRQNPEFDSYIEEAFWDAWIQAWTERPGLEDRIKLIPQYPVGRYYIDFAHVDSMTAIELDGFASHSSTVDIANDRKRQRWIEEQGWHVIRFGGKEVYDDAISCAREAYRLVEKRRSEITGSTEG